MNNAVILDDSYERGQRSKKLDNLKATERKMCNLVSTIEDDYIREQTSTLICNIRSRIRVIDRGISHG